jgi:hypothetical protein
VLGVEVGTGGRGGLGLLLRIEAFGQAAGDADRDARGRGELRTKLFDLVE